VKNPYVHEKRVQKVISSYQIINSVALLTLLFWE